MTNTQLMLAMGEIQTLQGDVEINVLGVGSGVVLVAYDGEGKVGGCAHFILPDPPPDYDRERPGKYAAVGVKEMLRKMVELGAEGTHIRAAIIGGAGMVVAEGLAARDLGSRNVAAVLDELGASGIECSARDVGGQFGRSLCFSGKSGTVRVRTGQLNEQVLCKLGG